MSLQAFPVRGTQPEVVNHYVRAIGETTGPEIVKQLGDGVTVTRTGAGAYRITWSENPGTFVLAQATLAAATPANLAGHTVVFDTWDSTNLRLDLVVYNATFAAHDLVDDEYLNITAVFKRTSV